MFGIYTPPFSEIIKYPYFNINDIKTTEKLLLKKKYLESEVVN